MATEIELDDNQHEGCYIYSPEAERPAKRQRLAGSSSPAAVPLFAPLLDGSESQRTIDLRYQTLRKLWGQQSSVIDAILRTVNAGTVNRVASFVDGFETPIQNGKIPTRLIVTGPIIPSHHLLFQQIGARLRTKADVLFVHLTAGESHSLKSTLKVLIRKSIEEAGRLGDDDDTHPARKRRLLDYDLIALCDCARKHAIQKVVIAFQDGQAMDGGLMTDLVCLLHAWLDRIPFLLLFGIGTSIELFQERLSRSAIQCMEADQLEVEQTDSPMELLFERAVGRESRLRPGPHLSTMLYMESSENFDGVQALAAKLKYFYMSHCYANPLSVLLADNIATQALGAKHFEAIRTLPSFRRFVESVLDDGDTQMVRSLMDDDIFLFSKVVKHTVSCQEALARLFDVIAVLQTISSTISELPYQSSSELYIMAVAGDLLDSSTLCDSLLYMKKMHSGKLRTLLEQTQSLQLGDSSLGDAIRSIQAQLDALPGRTDAGQKSIRSGHEERNDTLRTTVVAQKVQLRRKQAVLTEEEKSYTELVDRVHDLLQEYLISNIVSPQQLFLHEVFFYDLRAPHRAVFDPKPRSAIERALVSPHDYLGCSCCGTSPDSLSATQPATAILYQLFLETGTLINVFDLWSAFYSVVASEDSRDGDERRALYVENILVCSDPRFERVRMLISVKSALFYRALADLKFLGMIKHSRRRPDHIAKLSWNGL